MDWKNPQIQLNMQSRQKKDGSKHGPLVFSLSSLAIQM